MPSIVKTAEDIQYTLSLLLEAEKCKTRREELRYLEAGQHLRSLNQFLWQVPGMAIAVTGGVWYGVTTISADLPKMIALIFVAVVNVLTVPVIWRLRSLIGLQIKIQNEFSGLTFKDNWKYSVVSCWTALLVLAAAFSVLGVCNVSQLDKAPVPPNVVAPATGAVRHEVQQISIAKSPVKNPQDASGSQK